jgi:hypothetical protein
MSDDILTELKADWMECACYEGSLAVDREVIDRAAAEIERLRNLVAGLERDADRTRSRAKLADRDRRERIATACLAGLLADPSVDADAYEMSFIAVRFADALIARLDAEAQP